MRGAAVFAVLGALKSGAGVVRLASVGKCIDTVSILAPEATFIYCSAYFSATIILFSFIISELHLSSLAISPG